MEFLREYWAWILLPFVLVLGALAALYVTSAGGSAPDFVYIPF